MSWNTRWVSNSRNLSETTRCWTKAGLISDNPLGQVQFRFAETTHTLARSGSFTSSMFESPIGPDALDFTIFMDKVWLFSDEPIFGLAYAHLPGTSHGADTIAAGAGSAAVREARCAICGGDGAEWDLWVALGGCGIVLMNSPDAGVISKKQWLAFLSEL
jgi:hypothetical protein